MRYFTVGGIATAVAIGTSLASGGGGSVKLPCTTTVGSLAAASTALTAAAAGNVVCLSAGSYGTLDITQSKASDTTLQSAPGAAVTIDNLNFASGSSHIVVSDFTIPNSVGFASGNTHNTLQYSDVSGSSLNAIYFGFSTGGTFDALVTHNKIHGCGPTSATGGHCDEDAIRSNCGTANNNVTISYNSIYDVIEDPTGVIHDDAVQWCGGGSNLTFDHNYFHDNCVQNLFVKDGSVTTMNVTDNLFVRNSTVPPGGCAVGGITIHLFHITGLVLSNNTEWTDSGSTLRCESGSGWTANANHNVFAQFNNGPGDPCSFTLSHTLNIYGATPFTFTPSGGDTVNATPPFTDTSPSVDDWRLTSNPNGVGVDWKPSDYVYGPRL